jgi:FkbM family methyltransferase
VYLDVGANIGYFSAIAARLVAPGGRVVAFEPHPEARKRLVGLIAANGLEAHVEIDPSAVTDRMGVGQLHLTDDTVLSTLEPEKSPLSGTYVFDRSIDVNLTTLDAWLDARPDLATRVSMIKIDVEGAEDRALAGMDNLLRRAPGIRVICETRAGGEADRRMASLGFTCRPLDVWNGNFGNHAYERNSAGADRARVP